MVPTDFAKSSTGAFISNVIWSSQNAQSNNWNTYKVTLDKKAKEKRYSLNEEMIFYRLTKCKYEEKITSLKFL